MHSLSLSLSLPKADDDADKCDANEGSTDDDDGGVCHGYDITGEDATGDEGPHEIMIVYDGREDVDNRNSPHSQSSIGTLL